MSVKTIPVTMPEWVWGRLATIAENRRLEVADVIADAVFRVINEDPDVRAPREVA